MRILTLAVAATAVMSAAEPVAFTLEVKESITFARGQTALARETSFAQRSDCSWSESTKFYPRNGLQYTLRIVQLADGTRSKAYDSIGIKTSSRPDSPEAQARLAQERMQGRPTPESGCRATRGGQAAFAGYQFDSEQTLPAVKLRAFKFVRTNGGGEVWLAPDLACETVYRLTVFPDSRSEMTTTNFAAGVPETALFSFAGLREVSPITALRAISAKLGYPEEMVARQAAALQPDEERYNARQR